MVTEEKGRGENAEGAFDPQRAKALTMEVVDAFRGHLKKAERYMRIWLLVCVAVMTGALVQLQVVSSTKAIVVLGIVFLAALETSILVKLWYWIVNNKLSVLREVKLLRLASLHGSGPAAAPAGAEAGELFRRGGLSRGERTAWLAALFTLAIAIAVLGQLSQFPWITVVDENRTSLSNESYVTLSADGSATTVTRVSYPHYGAMPLTSFTFFYGPGNAPTKVRWLDAKGRELTYSTSQVKGNTQYTVQLIEPVMQGDQLVYTGIGETAGAATREGDLWTYKNDWVYGWNKNHYGETIHLPAGAQVVSTDPAPQSQWKMDQSSELEYQVTRGHNERFAYSVRYRLEDTGTTRAATDGAATAPAR